MTEIQGKNTPILNPWRLKNLSRSQHEIAPPFLLGGWVYPVSGEYLLTGQGSHLILQDQNLPFEPAEQVVLEVLKWNEGQGIVEEFKVLKRQVPKRVSDKPLTLQFERYVKWSSFLQEVRKYFIHKSLIEVSTPSLVMTPGMESELRPFATDWAQGASKEALYLPTSPEIHLKKMLSAGFTDIFEIKECFRNEETSPYHEPSFFMLEWYRAFADLDMIRQDLQGLLVHLFEVGLVQGQAVSIETHSMSSLFRRYLDFELLPETSQKDLEDLAQKKHLLLPEGLDWNDTFYFIFLEKIEPHLDELGAFLLTDYPPSMAALAKLNHRGFADRFEFYWNGVEIANAFNELQDVDEQCSRFSQENEKRRKKGERAFEVDPEFIDSLTYGLPQTGGIALGLERLFMVCQGLEKISDFKLFTFAEKSLLKK